MCILCILLEQPAVTKCMHNSVYMHIIYDDTAHAAGWKRGHNNYTTCSHHSIVIWWVTSSHHPASYLKCWPFLVSTPRPFHLNFAHIHTYTHTLLFPKCPHSVAIHPHLSRHDCVHIQQVVAVYGVWQHSLFRMHPQDY